MLPIQDERLRPGRGQLRASRLHGGNHRINRTDLPGSNVLHPQRDLVGSQVRIHDALQTRQQEVPGSKTIVF